MSLDQDTKFLLTAGVLASALGSLAERAVFFLVQAKTAPGNAALSALVAKFGDVGLQTAVAALVVPMFMIMADINLMNHRRVLGTSFVLGAIWNQPWDALVKIAETITKSAQ